MVPGPSMMPSRRSLVSDCARVMKARIAAGEWKDFLPGERQLAELLNVGRDTIRLMLAELTAEGAVDRGSAGKRRRILLQNSRPRKSRGGGWRIGMLSPFRLERLSQSMLAEVDHIRSILAQRGGVLDLVVPSWYDGAEPRKKLAKLLETEKRDAWILHRSSKAVQLAFQNLRTPCVIRGHPHPGVQLPHMDFDWEAVGRHAVGALWRKNHRRIAMLLPMDGMRGNTAAWQGATSFHEPGMVISDLWEDGSNENLVKVMTEALARPDPPTAVITIRPRQTITLLTWLGTKGLRVPQDLSLVSLATDPVMAHLVPAITSYQLDPLVFAKRVVRHLESVMAGHTGTHGSLLLMPEVLAGASVAAPPTVVRFHGLNAAQNLRGP